MHASTTEKQTGKKKGKRHRLVHLHFHLFAVALAFLLFLFDVISLQNGSKTIFQAFITPGYDV